MTEFDKFGFLVSVEREPSMGLEWCGSDGMWRDMQDHLKFEDIMNGVCNPDDLIEDDDDDDDCLSTYQLDDSRVSVMRLPDSQSVPLIEELLRLPLSKYNTLVETPRGFSCIYCLYNERDKGAYHKAWRRLTIKLQHELGWSPDRFCKWYELTCDEFQDELNLNWKGFSWDGPEQTKEEQFLEKITAFLSETGEWKSRIDIEKGTGVYVVDPKARVNVKRKTLRYLSKLITKNVVESNRTDPNNTLYRMAGGDIG
jgi:hypothetical protein